MNGLHELPLVIFTVLAQSVVGAFLLFSMVLFTIQDKFYRAYVHLSLIHISEPTRQRCVSRMPSSA